MIFSKTVLAAALALVALGAKAEVLDTLNFTVTGLSNVNVGYSWADAFWQKNNGSKNITYSAASSLGWALTRVGETTGGTNGSFLSQSTSAISGSGEFNFSSLSAANYVLTLSGTWTPQTGTGASTFTAGKGDLAAFATITPVPEPETYAMMLAGLGLMGTIARRRKQKNTTV